MFYKLIKEFLSIEFIKCLRLLSKKDRKKLTIVSLIEVLLSILDLIGVALIGLLGAITLNGIKSQKPQGVTYSVIRYLRIEGLTFQNQVAFLAIIVTGVFMGRTVFSMFTTNRTLRYLSMRSAVISEKMLFKIFSQKITSLQKYSSQHTLNAVTTGVQQLTVGVIGSLVSLVSDISLMFVLGIGLIFVQPVSSFLGILFFSIVGLCLYRFMNKKARELGKLQTTFGIKSSELILEAIATYRESTVRNRRNYYAREISNLRYQLSGFIYQASFMPFVSKYVVETALVLGALIISAAQFMLFDAQHAITSLSVFLAAGSRIAPAFLRIQQGLIAIKGSLGAAGNTFEILDEIEEKDSLELEYSSYTNIHTGFVPKIELKKLNFSYLPDEKKFIDIDDLIIHEGSSVAITGDSGAGKSTFVDLILGILKPISGEIKISNMNPECAVKNYPGAIAYVPQNIFIANDTIKANVCLSYPTSEINEELVWKALERAGIADFVRKLPEKLSYQVGENGNRLSGGQRQRIGIARALITSPRILVLDEATSSLDMKTERQVAESINSLKGEVTLIQIAHRLTTVKLSEKILHFQNGQIVFSGTYQEAIKKIPNFFDIAISG